MRTTMTSGTEQVSVSMTVPVKRRASINARDIWVTAYTIGFIGPGYPSIDNGCCHIGHTSVTSGAIAVSRGMPCTSAALGFRAGMAIVTCSTLGGMHAMDGL